MNYFALEKNAAGFLRFLPRRGLCWDENFDYEWRIFNSNSVYEM